MNTLPLSIVIPMYNRAPEIGRALKSCLSQDLQAFEIVVVDDGSADDSAAVVRAFAHPRIRLLRHARNRGVCPARNTGVDAARGEWVLFLDSDDALLPGALSVIHARIARAPESIGRLAFMYLLDTGGMSPQPAFQQTVWDYTGYLRWLEQTTGSSDYLNCVRRKTFERVRFPDGRAYETLYHFDFAQHCRTQCFPDAVAIVHSDSANRSCHNNANNRRRDSLDSAASIDELLERHGAALREHAPMRLRSILKMAASHHAAAGHRLRSSLLALQCLRQSPLSPEVWAQLVLGLLGPALYTRAAAFKRRASPASAKEAEVRHA